MNIDIFMSGISKALDTKYWLNIVNEENPITSVLTIQLCCECFVESYICACINVPDLFKKADSSEKDKITFNPPFITKLKLAQKLGLPIEAFRAIEYINTIRNQFAHRLDPTINIDHVNNVKKFIDQLAPEIPFFNYIETYNEDGTLNTHYKYDSPNTPTVIKLVIVYTALIKGLITHVNTAIHTPPKSTLDT